MTNQGSEEGHSTRPLRQVLDDLKSTVDSGISGDTPAGSILDAICSGRFWVFPNGKPFFPLVEQQHAQMLKQ